MKNISLITAFCALSCAFTCLAETNKSSTTDHRSLITDHCLPSSSSVPYLLELSEVHIRFKKFDKAVTALGGKAELIIHFPTEAKEM